MFQWGDNDVDEIDESWNKMSLFVALDRKELEVSTEVSEPEDVSW